MATAGARDASGNNLITATSGEAADSICPKGWRLPPKEGNKSYHNLLISSYNIPTNSDAALLAMPLSFIRAGGYYPGDGFFHGQGNRGFLWSSTVYDSDVTYVLSFGASGGFPQFYNYRGYSFSVRCVVR